MDYFEDHKGLHRTSSVKIGKYSKVICKQISSAFIHNKQTWQSVRQIGVLRRRLCFSGRDWEAGGNIIWENERGMMYQIGKFETGLQEVADVLNA